MLPDATTDIPAWAGKDKDEPFDVKKYLESRAAPLDNAAPLYFEAMAELCPFMDFVYPPDQWQERLPKVKALAEDISNVFDIEKLKNGSVSLTELERVLKNAESVQEKIDKAQKINKCIFITGMRIDSNLPHLDASGYICDLEVLQIYHAGKSGNFTEAEQAIKRMFRLTHDICQRGFAYALLTSIDLEKCIITAINKYTLDQNNLTTKECDHLIDMLMEQQHDTNHALQEVLQMDYIMGRNTIADVKQGRMTLEDIRKRFPKQPDNYFTDLGNYLPHANWQAEITAYNQAYSSILGMADRPYYEIKNRYETEVESKLRNQNVKLIDWIIPNIPYLLGLRAKEQAKLSSTLCMIAVRKYELTHGKPPPYLSTAIAGTVLKEIPVDPFTGKPMRYEYADGKYKISYGSDQQNSGGTGN
jgi:hypothetical protein